MFQLWEWLAIGTFALGFFVGTIELFMNPAKFKAKEILFFQDHKTVGFLDKLLFALAAASFAFLMIHFIVEQINIAQIFGYLMIIMYAVSFPLFFLSDSYSQHMLENAKKASLHKYILSGFARIVAIVIMIVVPVMAT